MREPLADLPICRFADSHGLPANSPILIPGHSSLPLGDRWSYFYDHH
jgi:hypothetical protein